MPSRITTCDWDSINFFAITAPNEKYAEKSEANFTFSNFVPEKRSRNFENGLDGYRFPSTPVSAPSPATVAGWPAGNVSPISMVAQTNLFNG